MSHQISFKRALLIGQRTTQAMTANHSHDFREQRFPVVLNFHRERWNPVKKHSKALVGFAVSKHLPTVYLADRGRAEIIFSGQSFYLIIKLTCSVLFFFFFFLSKMVNRKAQGVQKPQATQQLMDSEKQLTQIVKSGSVCDLSKNDHAAQHPSGL